MCTVDDEQTDYLVELAERELAKLDAKEPVDRGPIDRVWRAAARNELSVAGMAHWAQLVSLRVLECLIENRAGDGNENGNVDERARRALKALGFFGRSDDTCAERRFHELVNDFLPLAKAVPGERLTRRRKLLKLMRGAGFYTGVPDRDALKRIDRLDRDCEKSRVIASTRDSSPR